MDNQLDEWRRDGVKVRVVRDANPDNDIRGIVIAWNESDVLVRKQNRKVVKVAKTYHFQADDQPRELPDSLI
ncbi:MAG: hypothetical protein RLZZ267_1124 [Bacillota bacterium]